MEMHRVDLKAMPYCLNEEQIKWVEDTYAGLTLEEKVGQLFICMDVIHDPNVIRETIRKYHVGGLRWQGGTLEQIYEQNRCYQENSRVPLLIAAGCEAGGNDAVAGGTMVATGAACGAAPTGETAHDMGYVAANEVKAVGCNWTFAPLSDVLSNWRNTIVNFRAFGDDPDLIIDRCLAYMEGVHENGMICCTKHYPGDGSEERDQHLVMGCNDLSIEEWEASYGRIYRTLIEKGVESFMIGHICQPAWQRHFTPGLKDSEILPATLSPELLQGLLRGHLGFNGLIVTDASKMAGLNTVAPRSVQVPGVIAAGCDMFLFFTDPDEDFRYMLEGVKNGVITEERLSDAVHRILGMKAKLNLYKTPFPEKSELARVGCEAHHALAAKAADASITLVKDTQHLLPIDPARKKRALLFFIQSAPVSMQDGTDKAKARLVEELEKAGFLVDTFRDYYEMEMEHPSFINRHLISDHLSSEALKAAYDVIFVVTNMRGYAQENNVRIRWSGSHSAEVPWYCNEVPTVFVSLSYTNHLYDLPMARTFINAYGDTPEYLHALVEKITGRSEFRGKANDVVWCGRWDTRL